MKHVVMALSLMVLMIQVSAQDKVENGTIYIEHPYINIVNEAVDLYVQGKPEAGLKFYADTAMLIASGMENFISIEAAVKDWSTDADFYDSIKITKVGYPDMLHYKENDSKWVQSWWLWSGKSKKTGENLKIHFVQFSQFNKDGKISREMMYGDFSRLVKK